VTLTKADVGLGGADNTSDLNKPISTATQTALDGKAATVHTHPSSAITDFSTAAAAAAPVQSVAGKTGSVALVKADVGLGSVDNTADTAKPVSTAQQTALNGKANISHTHAVADVTGLQTALDGKAASSHTHTPSDVGLGNVSNTAQVTSVGGTAPIASSGGTTPTISISAATTGAAGSMSSGDKTKLDAITGTNTGDQIITLTGNVTGSGTGSFAATIANDAVDNTKLSNMAQSTLKGRATASTGDPEDLSASQVRTILNVADGATANTASTATPSALGTAAAGTATAFARADHVHSADILDSAFRVVGSSDASKKLAFEVDGIAAATTRTITVPNANITLDDSAAPRTPTAHTHTAADIDSELVDAGYVLTADGDGGASWEAATGGSPSSYEIKTESFTASVGGRYACDTSAGEVVPSQLGQLEYYGLRVFNSDEENSSYFYISVAEQEQEFYMNALELYVNQDETTYDTIIEFINDNGEDYGLSAELVDGYDGSDLLPPDSIVEDSIPQATPESFAYDLFEVTLPESPNSGDSFTLADASGTWANNAPEIVGLEDINGNPPPLTLDINGIANLLYVSGVGWKTLDSTRSIAAEKPAFSRETTTGSTSGLVTWDGGFDTTGGFADNAFVVPSGLGGLYMFNAAVFYNQPADTQMELGIYVNNSRVRAFYTATFDGEQGQAQVFGVVDLDVGDTVDVRVNFFGDEGAYVRTDGGVSWFTGVKL
jgi:hypothetical protein